MSYFTIGADVLYLNYGEQNYPLQPQDEMKLLEHALAVSPFLQLKVANRTFHFTFYLRLGIYMVALLRF